MEIQIVDFFRSWSCTFCNFFFALTNLLGEDLIFYLVFFALYWTYKKEFAFKYGSVYLFSCACNLGLKKIIKRPRPIGHQNSIFPETGYSFPSGHSQSYSSVAAGLVYEAHKNQFPKKRWMRVEILCELIIFGALVGIGRMYWGQHYLTDVLAGLILGVMITVAATYLLDVVIDKLKGTKITLDKVLIFLVPFVVIGYVLVITLDIFDDPDNLAKIYRMIGIYLSVVVGYFIDKKWIKYTTEDTIKNKFIKIYAGTAVLIVFYAMVIYKAEINAFLPIYYFVLGLIATVVLPWIFKTIKNEPQQLEDKKRK